MTFLRVCVLGLWTAGILGLLVVGRYALFIRAGFWPLMLGTALLFGLFLFTTIVRRGATKRPATASAWARSAMLVLPLVYMLPLMTGASARGLNHYALQKRSLGFDGQDSSAPSGDASGTAATATSMKTLVQHFNRMKGQHVSIEAKVFHDPEIMAADEMIVYRFVIVCCAADATPFQLMIRTPDVSKFKNDQWVRVEGTLATAVVDGKTVPAIDGATVSAIEAPQDPYTPPSRW